MYIKRTKDPAAVKRKNEKLQAYWIYGSDLYLAIISFMSMLVLCDKCLLSGIYIHFFHRQQHRTYIALP